MHVGLILLSREKENHGIYVVLKKYIKAKKVFSYDCVFFIDNREVGIKRFNEDDIEKDYYIPTFIPDWIPWTIKDKAKLQIGYLNE